MLLAERWASCGERVCLPFRVLDFLAAGPITAMLAGLGDGTTTGAVIGALVGVGIPEFEAKRYERRLKAGLALVVHCANSDEVERARKILEKNGSAEIGTAHEA